MIPVSNDTLLRVVRRHGKPPMTPPNVIGIDDWAWRCNFRYGTLVCDLERRRTIALLPDREPATAQAWLAEQQQIEIVARDRGGSYALAASRAVPHAVQVADRWHLMENASQAFLDAVRRSMRQIRQAIGAATINPKLLTSAEKLQYEGYQRREETNTAILDLAKDGTSIKEIVRRTGYSRKLVRSVLRGQQTEVFRSHQNSLEAHLPWLDDRARESSVASFANGVLKDRPAVAAAITSPWSNGQTEGQITKLKLVKRQMYGRGKLDLLEARVIGAS